MLMGIGCLWITFWSSDSLFQYCATQGYGLMHNTLGVLFWFDGWFDDSRRLVKSHFFEISDFFRFPTGDIERVK